MQGLWKKISEPFRKHSEWWNNYLTELSVFVISLGATYYADSLVKSYMERQEDREAVGMVRNELMSNLSELESIATYYRKEIQLSETLRKFLAESGDAESGDAVSGDTVSEDTVSGDTVSGDTVSRDTVSEGSVSRNVSSVDATSGKADEDSIKVFYNQHRLFYYWFLKDNAFSMIRESGTMQRMDKALLTELFECYEQLEVVKDMGLRYREERISELLLLTDALPEGKHAETTIGQWKQIAENAKFCRYLLTSLPMMAKSALSISMNAEQLIEKMLDDIDKQFPPDD